MAAVGGRLVKVGITAGTTYAEYSAYLTNARFSAADSDNDTITFADAAAGGAKDYTFAGTMVQDDGGNAASLWEMARVNSGATVSLRYMPQGTTTASTTAPHWTATAVIAAWDGDFLGGDANSSATFKNTVDFSWELTGPPTKVTS